MLEDGAEVDKDTGLYERLLDLQLRRENHITTGKVYSKVIQDERCAVVRDME